MDAKSFFELVANMRQAQQRWYEYHTYNYLGKAKHLEKQVDAEIERVRTKRIELELDF